MSSIFGIRMGISATGFDSAIHSLQSKTEASCNSQCAPKLRQLAEMIKKLIKGIYQSDESEIQELVPNLLCAMLKFDPTKPEDSITNLPPIINAGGKFYKVKADSYEYGPALLIEINGANLEPIESEEPQSLGYSYNQIKNTFFQRYHAEPHTDLPSMNLSEINGTATFQISQPMNFTGLSTLENVTLDTKQLQLIQHELTPGETFKLRGATIIGPLDDSIDFSRFALDSQTKFKNVTMNTKQVESLCKSANRLKETIHTKGIIEITESKSNETKSEQKKGINTNIGQESNQPAQGFLNGASLKYVVLSESFLILARNKGTLIEGADFSGQDWSDIDFSGITFINCRFKATNLTRANFFEAKLVGCTFTRANLKNATLKNAEFTLTEILGANLMGADWSGAKFNQITNDAETKIFNLDYLRKLLNKYSRKAVGFNDYLDLVAGLLKSLGEKSGVLMNGYRLELYAESGQYGELQWGILFYFKNTKLYQSPSLPVSPENRVFEADSVIRNLNSELSKFGDGGND